MDVFYCLIHTPEAITPELCVLPGATEVEAVRERGYALSHDEVIPNLKSIAVPLPLRGARPAALAVVHVASRFADTEIAARLTRSADVIRAALDG